jgi:hypothetical protein
MKPGPVVNSDAGSWAPAPADVLQRKGSCPGRLPKLSPPKATARRLGNRWYAIKATASIAGVGRHPYTNDLGIAIIKLRGNPRTHDVEPDGGRDRGSDQPDHPALTRAARDG